MSKVVPMSSTNIKIDNEILNKKIENLETALALCQNNENVSGDDPDAVSKLASESIIKDLLS